MTPADEIGVIVSQLRHAYHQLVLEAVSVEHLKEFGDGLLAPAIRKLEQLQKRLTEETYGTKNL